MNFRTIYEKEKRPNETLILMKYIYSGKNDFGEPKKILEEIQTIKGIIQLDQQVSLNKDQAKGQESEPIYTGYFCPEFNLKQSEINEYRIKYIKREYETLIMKVRKYDPNLYLMGEQDHIQIELILEKQDGL